MTPPVAFADTLAEAELRLEGAGEEPTAMRHALTWGCAVLEGYFRAGLATRTDFDTGCHRLRTIVRQRVALRELREALVAGGIGGAA